MKLNKMTVTRKTEERPTNSQPIRMTIRPRLWRVGAATIYLVHVTPTMRIALGNIVIAFVRPFMRMQQREKWHRVK